MADNCLGVQMMKTLTQIFNLQLQFWRVRIVIIYLIFSNSYDFICLLFLLVLWKFFAICFGTFHFPQLFPDTTHLSTNQNSCLFVFQFTQIIEYTSFHWPLVNLPVIYRENRLPQYQLLTIANCSRHWGGISCSTLF